MLRKQAVIYNTLYEPQKRFVDELIDKRGALKPRDEAFKWGFFLKMGFGKTKIMTAMAELHEADLILITTEKSKMLERDNEGEFPAELAAAGYKTFYSDKMGSKKYEREFLDALNKGEKIVYMFNWAQINAKKGYSILNWIVGGLDSLKSPDRRRWLEDEYNKSDKTLTFDEFINNKGPQYKNIVWIMDEAHAVNNKSARLSKTVNGMLYNKNVPGLQITRSNYFRERIKAVYLGTGTPMTGKYYENYYWLLTILGHRWGETPIEVSLYEEQARLVIDANSGRQTSELVEKCIGKGVPPVIPTVNRYNKRTYRVETRKLSAYEYFVNRYCVINEETKMYDPDALNIIGFKRIPELLDIVEHYAFFGETAKHFELPPVMTEIKWVAPGTCYKRLFDKKSPHYLRFEDKELTSAAEIYLRSRQALSGFMGNSEHYVFYSEERTLQLRDFLMRERSNYIIFYHWDPELYAIVDAVQQAGYNYDIYKGDLKEYEVYKNYEKGEGNVVIANIASGAKALNRQKWNSVLFYSLPSVYALYEQAIGRVLRLGQTAERVFVGIFLAKGTVDEYIYNNLINGRDYTEQAFARDFLDQIK